jgi:hypothetical protein
MDEILNSNNLSNIRFRMAKPQGYYTEDVEKFIDVTVRESVIAYQNEISENQKTINGLSERVNQLNSRIAELELKDNFSSASSNLETDDALMASLVKQEELEAENTDLKTKLAVAEQNIAARDENIKQLNDYIDAITPFIPTEGSVAATAVESKTDSPVSKQEPVIEEDLTSYDSDDVIPQVIHDSEDEESPEPSLKPQAVDEEPIIDNNALDFDSTPEVDIDMLNEELMKSGANEEEHEEEHDTLPDGTVVPKGIRPEDL